MPDHTIDLRVPVHQVLRPCQHNTSWVRQYEGLEHADDRHAAAGLQIDPLERVAGVINFHAPCRTQTLLQ